MTNQRFSLSRLAIGGVLVLAACGTYAQDAAHNPNPFQPPQATAVTPSASATQALSTSPALPPATTARLSSDTGPLTLPPPIPVPLEKTLPKLARQPSMPAASAAPVLPPPPPAPAASKEDDLPAPAKAQAAAPSGPSKVRAFLSREKIEASRARCQVSFKGRNLVQLGAGDVEQIVQLTGAKGCLTAMSADADWLDVEYRGNNELMLLAHANMSDTSRRGQVTVVTPNQTFVLTVRQAAEPVTPTPASSMPVSPSKEKAPAPVAAPAKVTPVEVSASTTAEPEYDSARARLTGMSDLPKPSSRALTSLANREPAVPPLIPVVPLNAPLPTFELPEIADPKLQLLSLEAMRNAAPVVSVDTSSSAKVAMPRIDLPDVRAPPLELRSFAMRKERAPLVFPEVFPTLTVPALRFELPEVRGSPLDQKPLAALQKEVPPPTVRVADTAPLPATSASLPEVAEQSQLLKSLATPRDAAPSVAVLSADELHIPSVSRPLLTIAAPAPSVVESEAPVVVVHTPPVVDATHAKAVLSAVFSATEPAFSEPAAADQAKTPATTRPAYVPPGYITLDEYTPETAVKDAPKPTKKTGEVIQKR